MSASKTSPSASTLTHASSTYQDTPLSEVQAVHDLLYATHASRKCQPIEYRLHYLKQLGYMLQDHSDAICETVRLDLGRSYEETAFGEVWVILHEVELAVARLAEWMKDESGFRDTHAGFKLNRPRVKKQPKGPALIVGPWNYPWQLNLGPLLGAIAAGCPAVVKPSEHSKHSSALFAQLVEQYLDPEAHRVVLGAVDHSTQLLDLEWAHIYFTGSTAIGRVVAQAAAKNLVPCTLELGGKSPVIICPSADLKISARRILSIKAMGCGQMCTNADYVLCPRDLVPALMQAMRETLQEFYPDPLKTPAQSQMIHERAYERIAKMLDGARSQGKEIIGGETDASQRRVSVTVVKMNDGGQGESGPLLQEELFGPLLPIVPVEDVDAAIAYVNARPHPLALYVFSKRRADYEYVLERTLSGGSCFNDISIQTIQVGIPFGGVGQSGYGAGHGKNYFDTFTHRRAAIEVPFHMEPFMKLRYPNAGPIGHKIFKFLLGGKLSFKRSPSVEAEKPKGFVRRNARLLLGALLVVATAVGTPFGRARLPQSVLDLPIVKRLAAA